MKQIKKLTALFCCVLLAFMSVNLGDIAYAAAKATLQTNSVTIKVKETSKIVLNSKYSKATYSYKSSDSKVATVSKSGTITGIKAGSASITVSETYKKKTTTVGKVAVTVRPALDREAMIARSLVSTGNNYRLKNAIEKAQKGEKVTIAYLGGSITEGAMAHPNEASYAYLSYKYFRDTYGKGDGSNVKYLNAGMSGTPSILGMIRYDKDVTLRAESAPDIVFVEFAVNDGDDPTNGDAYESLVRNILNSDNHPAVVLLFSIFKSRWNLQDRLEPVGTFYNLPMVSIKDAILPELNSGALSDAEYFADIYHPTNDGHKIMADCIDYLFDTVNKEAKAESDITVPADQAKIGHSFDGVKMIDSRNAIEGVTVEKGGFSEVDPVIGTFMYAPGTRTFPDNFKHSVKSGSGSLKITLECKNFLVVYKQTSSMNQGKIDVYVDGVKKQTIDGHVAGGWNNPYTKLIFNEAASAKHTIEIKMAPDSSSKDFTVMALGYTK